MYPNDKTPHRRPHLFSLVIYPKDVALIFRIAERTARKKIEEAKKMLGKQKRSFLTIREFCECFELEYEEIIALLDE